MEGNVDKSKLALLKKKQMRNASRIGEEEEFHHNDRQSEESQQEIQEREKGRQQVALIQSSLQSNPPKNDQHKDAIRDIKQTCNSMNSVSHLKGQPTVNSSHEVRIKNERPAHSLPSQTNKLSIQWTCNDCHQSCIPVRSESRCLCGHRYKEHKFQNTTERCQCSVKNCPCQQFYFIVAEGAWILRCRCKHKHIDHDPSQTPFLCKKSGCSCTGFDSPWVCNCGHSWANHTQSTSRTQMPSMIMRSSNDQNHQEMQEMISDVMKNDAMNDMKSDMMYRRDGER